MCGFNEKTTLAGVSDDCYFDLLVTWPSHTGRVILLMIKPLESFLTTRCLTTNGCVYANAVRDLGTVWKCCKCFLKIVLNQKHLNLYFSKISVFLFYICVKDTILFICLCLLLHLHYIFNLNYSFCCKHDKTSVLSLSLFPLCLN